MRRQKRKKNVEIFEKNHQNEVSTLHKGNSPSIEAYHLANLLRLNVSKKLDSMTNLCQEEMM